MGKKEGDTVELTIHKRRVVVTCAQQTSKHTDNFENMLYGQTQSFGGVCDESYYKPPFSRRSQYAMLISNHEKYARSLCLKIKEPTDFNYSSSYINQCKIDLHKTPNLSWIE